MSRIGGYDIPIGTMLIINHAGLQLDPTQWNNSDSFDPTRFLDEEGNLDQKPRAWLPFSAGRRVCLGETIAKPELLVVLSTFLQQFDISLPNGTKPDLSMRGSSLSGVYPGEFKVMMSPRF